MPSRRAAVTTAAGILLAALPPIAASAGTPEDLPGSWAATCVEPSSRYCIASATITPTGGAATPLTGVGLTATVATVADDTGDWVR